MSDGKARSGDTNQEDRGGPTYAQLRELAAKRAEARRGISRRDFVTAGAATAFAAVAARASSAGETPLEAYNLCIDKMKKGADGFSWEGKVLEKLNEVGPPIFKTNINVWPGSKDRVLAASFAIGQIAAALALLNNKQEDDKQIKYPDAKEAVAVVKRNCTVRWNLDVKGIFCPDLP